MKRKVRKFQEGGFSAAQEEWLGGADRTDPYILARMRKAVPDRVITKTTEVVDDSPAGKSGYGEENELPTTTRVPNAPAKTPATKPVAKPTGPTQAEIDAEKKRMEDIGKRQGLQGFYPEEMLIGGGSLKLLREAGKKLAGKIGSRLKTYTPSEIEAMTPKLPKPPVPRLSRENLKLGMKKGGSVKKMASGGKVSSASKRADGCAVKGKTRGRIV